MYNSLAISRSTIVHLPVSIDGLYQVTKPDPSPSTDVDKENNEDKELIRSHPSMDTFDTSQRHFADDVAKYVIPIDTGSLPPLGASLFKISLVQPIPGTKSSSASSTFSSMLSTVKNSLRHRTAKTMNRDADDANIHEDDDDDDFIVSNDFFAVTFDGYVNIENTRRYFHLVFCPRRDKK